MADQRVSEVAVEKEPVDHQEQKRLLERTRIDTATSDTIREQLQQLEEQEGDAA